MSLKSPVTDIMTLNPDVLEDTLPIREAARLLQRRRYGGMPVVSGDKKLVGVLSFKDILEAFGTRTKPASLQGDPLHGFYVDGDVVILDGSLAPIDHVTGVVKDAMSKTLITVTIDDTVLDAAKLFAEKNVHRVPVVDGAGDLVGIVTTADIVRHIANTAS